MSQIAARMIEAVRRRPYALLLSLVLIGLAVPFCRRSNSDWDSVYVVAARHLRDGESIFQNSYQYPPISAWLALPFTYLSGVPGRLAWYGVNALALVVMLTSAWRLSGGGRLQGDPAVPHREHAVLALGLLASIYFAMDVLSNQQTDLFVGSLVLGGCLLLANKRDLWAAVSFGVAAGIKCTPLLWAPYLIWRGRWRAAGVVVVVALAVNLLRDLTHPPAEGEGRLKQWVGMYLSPMARREHAAGTWGCGLNFNHSVAGVCNRWNAAYGVWNGKEYEPTLRAAPLGTVAVKGIILSADVFFVLAALVVSRRQRGGPAGGEYSLVLILMLFLSPMSGKPHFCTLMLPAFYLARVAVERRDVLPRLLLAGAILAGLMANKDLVGNTVYQVALWYGSVFGNCVLLFAGCLACLYPRRETVAPPERLLQAA